MSKFDGLSHRPFLVIDILVTPSDAARTERKGWYEKHAIPTEHPRIVDRISNTTLITASVIIDLTRNQVIKDRNPTMTPEEAVSYYSQKYAALIGSTLDQRITQP